MYKTTTEMIDPSTYQGQERENLIEELYHVQQTVFAGVDRDTFVRYVIDSPAQKSWIQLFRDMEGQLVGYLAVHRFSLQDDGTTCTIFRAETGVLREYRGRTNVGLLLGRLIISHLLRHPLHKVYFLGCLVHPSSYHGLARYAAEIWPQPQRTTPPEIMDLMCRLGDHFGLPKVAENNPLVRQVGWITRDTTSEHLSWQQSAKPTVQFFLENNPGYSVGHGILTLLPQTLDRVVTSYIRACLGRFQRNMRRLLHRSLHLIHSVRNRLLG